MSIIASLIEGFPVRRSKEQKAAFRAWAIEQGAKLGFPGQTVTADKHDNVVFGDPLAAKVTFTAHYDTPARGLFANRMLPRNRGLAELRKWGMIGAYILAGSAVGVPVGLIAGNWRVGFMAGWLVYMALVMLMLVGPANKHNVNDNSSGTAAMLEIMARIPAQDRAKAAFILFDDEEKGLLGSKAFAKAHPDFKKHGLLVNLDCVGDGDHLLIASSKLLRESAAYEALVSSLVADGDHEIHHFPLETSRFNSDQKHFKTCAAVCACRLNERGVFYTDRIHTDRDTVCEQSNLDVLAAGLSAFVSRLE